MLLAAISAGTNEATARFKALGSKFPKGKFKLIPVDNRHKIEMTEYSGPLTQSTIDHMKRIANGSEPKIQHPVHQPVQQPTKIQQTPVKASDDSVKPPVK